MKKGNKEKHVEQQKPSVARARIAQCLQQTSKPSLGETSKEMNFGLFYALNKNNTFFVQNAQFCIGDDSRDIMIKLDKEVISWDKDGGAKMSLIIDAKKIFEVDTNGRLQGVERLRIDGLLVDFTWDLYKTPKSFTFLTREFSFHTKAFGELGYHNHWEDDEHVSVIEILEYIK